MKHFTSLTTSLALSAMIALCSHNAHGHGLPTSSISPATQTSSAVPKVDDKTRLLGDGYQFYLHNDLAPLMLYMTDNPESSEVIIRVVDWTKDPSKATNNEEDEEENDKEKNDLEDLMEQSRWRVQQTFKQNVHRYTKALGSDGEFLNISFASMQTDGDYGTLGNHTEPMAGVNFQFSESDFPLDEYNDGYISTTFWIFPESYLSSRKQLKLERLTADSSEDVPKLPAKIVARLEKQYGLVADTTELTHTIGNDYLFGTIQFKPKGKTIMAMEVLIKGDQIWTFNNEAEYDPEDQQSIWNVDDGGLYVGNVPQAAFIGPEGLELFFERGTAEGHGFGWLLPEENGKLRDCMLSYYYRMGILNSGVTCCYSVTFWNVSPTEKRTRNKSAQK